MLSQAGRVYERSKIVRPFGPKQRQRVYERATVQYSVKKPQPRFSPFNTVSRSARDSYLLRVTCEPNPQTNYNFNPLAVLKSPRQPTIDQAPFERIIGPMPEMHVSMDLSCSRQRCSQSLVQPKQKIMTAREAHKWRKTMEHFDFSKQYNPHDSQRSQKLSREDSTNSNLLKTLNSVTESNYNNFARFSLQPRVERAHDFTSDAAHMYLQEVESRDKSPEYDITKGDESIIRRAMSKAKGENRFGLFKQRTAVRIDRADPWWHTKLQYKEAPTNKIRQTISFRQTTDREDNLVHSNYPILLSLTKEPPRGLVN